MKTKLALVFSVLLLALASTSQAGWGRGCGWGGGWGGPRFYGGGWGGGYCGPRFYGGGWGGGFYGPSVGIAIAPPVTVYRPVYYASPAPAYYPATRVVSSVRSSQTALVQAQAQLARLGYYRGQVDGSFGPLTSRALTLFQADNGLRVTGRLDSATLDSLGS